MITVNYENGMESLNNNGNLKFNVPDEMNIDGNRPESAVSKNYSLVKSIGKVVLDLRNIGFTALTEDAYASSIIQLLKVSVYRAPLIIFYWIFHVKKWLKLTHVVG